MKTKMARILSVILSALLILSVIPFSATAYDESLATYEVYNSGIAIYTYVGDSGCTRVRFPTWTDYNGQDDIVWHEANSGDWNVNGHYYNWAAWFPISQHNSEGGVYNTHIYKTVNGSEVMHQAMSYSVNTSPTVQNVKAVQNGTDGYYIYACVSTNGTYDISVVKFPTWTTNNGQDDLASTWPEGESGSWTIDGAYFNYRCYQAFSSHNGETGEYITHVYAYNTAGNTNTYGISFTPNLNTPSITRKTVVQDSDTSYTVYVQVETNGGYDIDRVQFPTWTSYNSQDDLASEWGTNSTVTGTYGAYTVDGQTYNYAFSVFASDHNNESGAYCTDIYAYNKGGMVSSSGITTDLEPNTNEPAITRVTTVQDGSSGYTVYAQVETNGGWAIDRVQFPTWTELNLQDDLQSDWETSAAASGTAGEYTVDGQTYNYKYYVPVTSHNNEYGTYFTHIYAFNASGLSCSNTSTVFNFAFTITYKNYDNSVLQTTDYNYGATPSYTGETPAKAYDETNHYVFNGWFPTVSTVTSGKSYTAQFTTVPHTFTSTVKTAATCTAMGTTTYTCTCGYSYDAEDISAKGHTAANPVKENIVDATCTETGSYDEVVYCKDCNTEISRTEKTIPVKEHSFTNYVYNNDATCLADGTETATCDNCTATDKRTATGTKLSHDYSGDVLANNDGTHSYKCVNGCGEYGAKADCTYSSQITKMPTCSEMGTTKYTCTVCGYSYSEQNLAKIAHSPADAVKENIVEATCTATGSYDEVIYCKDCKAVISKETKTTAINPDNHTGEANVVKNAKTATCTEKGYTGDTYYSCCDALASNGTETAIDPANHTGEANVVKNAKTATCTEKGYTGDTYYSCCDALASNGTETAIDPANHTGEANVVKNAKTATCTEKGYTGDTYYSCCDALASNGTETAIDPANHTGEANVVKNAKTATCTEKGYTGDTYYSCCDALASNGTETAINPANHTGEANVVKNAKTATCTEKGYTGDTYYSCCGVIASNGTEIPAKGHSYVKTTVKPTCTKEGANIYVCSVCNDTYSEPIAKVDHTPGEAVKENTDDDAGTYDSVVYCTVCGAELSRTQMETGYECPACEMKAIAAQLGENTVIGKLVLIMHTILHALFNLYDSVVK